MDEAFTGLFEKTERWQQLLGLVVLWIMEFLAGKTTALPQMMGGQLEFLLLTFCVSAFLIYVSRVLFFTPVSLIYKERLVSKRLARELAELSQIKSRLSVRTEGWAFYATRELPLGMGFFVKIKNESFDEDVKDCQLELSERSDNSSRDDNLYVSSDRFDMKPQQEKILPILFFDNDNAESCAYIVHFAPKNTEWFRSALQCVLCEKSYTLKLQVLASNNPPALLNLRLKRDGKWGVTKC